MAIDRFEFSEEDKKTRFDGKLPSHLRGIVVRVYSKTVDIKFDGDLAVSKYPITDFPEFVVSRYYEARAVYHFGDIAIKERSVNMALQNDLCETDVMNFAIGTHMGKDSNSQDMPIINVAPRVVAVNTYALSLRQDPTTQELEPFCDHFSPKTEFILLPYGNYVHFSLFAFSVKESKFYHMDSGHGKLFAHKPAAILATLRKVALHCDSYQSLTQVERAFDTDVEVIKVTVQPNGVDCGFHTILNALHLYDHLMEGEENTIENWQTPNNSLDAAASCLLKPSCRSPSSQTKYVIPRKAWRT